MKKGDLAMPRAVFLILLAVSGLWAAGMAVGTAGAADDATPSALATIARGGRLYDDWPKEIGADALRLAESSLEKKTTRPARCVSCHGWDYRGREGALKAIPGAAGSLRRSAGVDPARIEKLLVDANHGYAPFLEPRDLGDIAQFVSRGQIDMDTLIDPMTLRARAEAGRVNDLFQTICATCHGNDGQMIADGPPLGELARANPWRAMHTLLNGHPDGNMPALRAFDPGLLVKLLASLQELPTREMLASIVRGGRLYDTWYKENGKTVPAGLHPAYPPALAKGVDARTTWRCKECHGWDYRGKDGVAADDARRTGIKGITGMVGARPEAVIAVLSDHTHQYGGLLSLRDMSDLANFVSRGQIDVDVFIRAADRTAIGDDTRFAPFYDTICATCHGLSGRDIRTMPPLGRVANSDPWRALHGILHGHPGEAMPPLRALPSEVAAGILAHSQKLPTRR